MKKSSRPRGANWSGSPQHTGKTGPGKNPAARTQAHGVGSYFGKVKPDMPNSKKGAGPRSG